MINMKLQSKPISIGCDHAGISLKNSLIDFMNESNIEVLDCGCYDSNSVDYPDIAQKVCGNIKEQISDKGILICGTGIGISIAANKIDGIRAALCHDSFSALYTRLHNDANVICFGARVIGSGLAANLLEIFLSNDFEGGRHSLRVDKITRLEKEQQL